MLKIKYYFVGLIPRFAGVHQGSRVGFLPAETCFCQTSGLNRFKPAKSGKNQKPLRPHGMKTAGVIIKVVNHINHQ